MQKAFHQDSMGAYTVLSQESLQQLLVESVPAPVGATIKQSRLEQRDQEGLQRGGSYPISEDKVLLCLVDLGASASPGILPISSVHLPHTWN